MSAIVSKAITKRGPPAGDLNFGITAMPTFCIRRSDYAGNFDGGKLRPQPGPCIRLLLAFARVLAEPFQFMLTEKRKIVSNQLNQQILFEIKNIETFPHDVGSNG